MGSFGFCWFDPRVSKLDSSTNMEVQRCPYQKPKLCTSHVDGRVLFSCVSVLQRQRLNMFKRNTNPKTSAPTAKNKQQKQIIAQRWSPVSSLRARAPGTRLERAASREAPLDRSRGLPGGGHRRSWAHREPHPHRASWRSCARCLGSGNQRKIQPRVSC